MIIVMSVVLIDLMIDLLFGGGIVEVFMIGFMVVVLVVVVILFVVKVMICMFWCDLVDIMLIEVKDIM